MPFPGFKKCCFFRRCHESCQRPSEYGGHRRAGIPHNTDIFIIIEKIGALIGLVIAIILIIKKVHPAYSLILGALIGGFIGGGGLTSTVVSILVYIL